MIGIDRGVRVLIATSEGDRIPNPRFGKSNTAAAMHARAITDATVWGPDGKAANRKDRKRSKAASRLRRAKERGRNARRDYFHKRAREIIDAYSVIALEKLNVRMMTRSAWHGTVEAPGKCVRAKTGLNKALLDSAFGLLHSMIVATQLPNVRRVRHSRRKEPPSRMVPMHSMRQPR